MEISHKIRKYRIKDSGWEIQGLLADISQEPVEENFRAFLDSVAKLTAMDADLNIFRFAAGREFGFYTLKFLAALGNEKLRPSALIVGPDREKFLSKFSLAGLFILGKDETEVLKKFARREFGV